MTTLEKAKRLVETYERNPNIPACTDFNCVNTNGISDEPCIFNSKSNLCMAATRKEQYEIAKKYIAEHEPWEPKEGELVYISDVSVGDALQDKCEIIFLAKWKNRFICVNSFGTTKYPDGDYVITVWKYIAKIPEKAKETVTTQYSEKDIEKIVRKVIDEIKGER
jgi:hypothetical protein